MLYPVYSGYVTPSTCVMAQLYSSIHITVHIVTVCSWSLLRLLCVGLHLFVVALWQSPQFGCCLLSSEVSLALTQHLIADHELLHLLSRGREEESDR